MIFISESQLKNYSRSANLYLSLNESLKKFKDEGSYGKTKIFLSHKHDELDFLEGAISFLKKFCVDVYVDWLDEGMPKKTSSLTAERLKNKIKDCDKFILLATEGAINSKWCNWELGLGDAAKYIENIAILPIKKDYSDFSASEYLEIYPYILVLDRIQYFKGQYRAQGPHVVYPALNGKNKVVTMKEWLQKR